MLYFSETAWTLPDIMDVNDEFESNYDGDAYEKKIAQPIKKATSRARKQQPEEFEAWREAIRHLSKEDRYLLVMVEQARLGATFRPPRPPFDLWRLWAAGLAVVSLFGVFCWILIRYHLASTEYSSSPRSFLGIAAWAFAVCLVAVYGLLRLLVGAQRIGYLTFRVMGWIFGMPVRRNK